MLKKLSLSVLILLLASIALVNYFFSDSGCPSYPKEVNNPTMGEYTIVALRQGCGLARGHQEYYVKRNDDDSDGYRKNNLIVETRDGHVVKVEWVETNVIRVKFYGEETLRKVSKSVFKNEIQIEYLDWNSKNPSQ